jgi:predicted nucleotidyltransferase
VTAVVYGSVARGQERPSSDIDLFIVAHSEQAKRDVRQSAGRLWERVSKEFGNSLSVHVNTVSELQRKVRRGLPVLREILRHHHLVWGQPLLEILERHEASSRSAR